MWEGDWRHNDDQGITYHKRGALAALSEVDVILETHISVWLLAGTVLVGLVLAGDVGLIPVQDDYPCHSELQWLLRSVVNARP